MNNLPSVNIRRVLPSVNIRRVTACTGALAFTLAACTACVGSSSPSSGPSTGVGNTGSASAGATGTIPGGTTTAAATTGGGGSATGTATTGSSGAPQACLTENLSATVTSSGAAAGSDYVNIVFKNIGNAACTLYGYPGVSFGAGAPVEQVGQPAARNPQVSPLTVTLIPNAHAFALLQVADTGNYPSNDCKSTPTTDLRVYPPNNNTLLYASFPSTACTTSVVTLHVEAMQPGSGS